MTLEDKEVQLEDAASERGILAGVYNLGWETFVDVDTIVTVNSFVAEANQYIYSIMKAIYDADPNTKIDLPLFMSKGTELGHEVFLSRPEEVRHLRAIINYNVEPANVRKMAAKVRKLEIARLLDKQLDIAKENLNSIRGDETISHILGIVENPIFDFSNLMETDSGPTRVGDTIQDYIQHLVDNPSNMVGLPTGMPLYDAAIGGGLRRGTVNVIGARPKVGKTSISINVGKHLAVTLGIPVLNLDTEMTTEDHQVKLLSNLSGVKITDIETGKFANNEQDKKLVNEFIPIVQGCPYYHISIAGKPFEEILAIARRWLVKEVGKDENGVTKPCLIIYDYLKLMDAGDVSNKLAEFQIIGFQVTSLHNFTVRHQVPCLTFVQLNRDAVTKSDTTVISQSDRTIWLCSNFSIFRVKTEDEINMCHGIKNGNRKLVPIVQRHGPGLQDGDYINMIMEGDCCRITEGKTFSELQRELKVEGFEITNIEQEEEIIQEEIDW